MNDKARIKIIETFIERKCLRDRVESGGISEGEKESDIERQTYIYREIHRARETLR